MNFSIATCRQQMFKKLSYWTMQFLHYMKQKSKIPNEIFLDWLSFLPILKKSDINDFRSWKKNNNLVPLKATKFQFKAGYICQKIELYNRNDSVSAFLDCWKELVRASGTYHFHIYVHTFNYMCTWTVFLEIGC